MAERIATANARKGFADLVQRSASGERIKLTRYGKTQAILIPKSDLAMLEDCEGNARPRRPQRKAPARSRKRR
jgi:antitoxin (DNA-binding transcriptional repressor) of toxin-antitoxin stability system